MPTSDNQAGTEEMQEMRHCTGIAFTCLALLGCTVAPKEQLSAQSTPVSLVETRILSKGLLQISTSFTENLNNFTSRCSGALIHTPDLSLDSCVAITAANCFHNYPKSALHVVEMFDGRGNIVRSYPVSGITQHPDFKAQDGTQTRSQAARDIALVEFNCALPAAIQPSKLTHVSALGNTSRLYTASFERVEQPQEEDNMLTLITFGWYKKEIKPVVHKMTHHKMQFRNLETPDTEKFISEKNPPAVVNIDPIQEPCDGQSGAPLFMEKDNDLFLVGISSSGAGYCEKNKLRFTAASHHSQWIKEVLRTKDLLAPESSPTIARNEPSNTAHQNSTVQPPVTVKNTPLADGASRNLPKPSDTLLDLVLQSETQIDKKPKSKKSASKKNTVSLAAKKPLRNLDTEASYFTSEDASVLEEQAQMNEPEKEREDVPPVELPKPQKSQKPLRASPNIRIDVPPIPPSAAEETQEPCMGVRLITQSKSRVWGTVVNLVDKDSTQINDNALKCELPNGHALCVVSTPSATGSGLSRTVLSQDVNHQGCGKFYSGRIIYLYSADFEVGQ